MTNQNWFSDFVVFVQRLFSTDTFIPLHEPRFRGNERQYVIDAIESTYVSSVGEYVNTFEKTIEKYTGAEFAIATNNGTSALHTALLLSGAGDGNEVITQPLTFVATCNAISYSGAKPVFVDIESSTLGLSPESLGAFINEYAEVRDDGLCWNIKSNNIIRSCIPMHTLGHPARTTEIGEICSEYNICLIEDASESLGSFRNGLHTGRAGKMGTLSFNGNKVVTTGGGGAIITDDEQLAKRARKLTTTARKIHPWLYEHDELGFNYRLPNLNAALGVAQMEQLPYYIKSKRKLAKEYQKWCEEKGVEIFMEPPDTCSNYWLNALDLKDLDMRDKFLEYTNSRYVMTRPMWTLMTDLPMYQNCLRADLSNSRAAGCSLVNIPSSVV